MDFLMMIVMELVELPNIWRFSGGRSTIFYVFLDPIVYCEQVGSGRSVLGESGLLSGAFGRSPRKPVFKVFLRFPAPEKPLSFHRGRAGISRR